MVNRRIAGHRGSRLITPDRFWPHGSRLIRSTGLEYDGALMDECQRGLGVRRVVSTWLYYVYNWLFSEFLTHLGFLLALVLMAGLLRQRRSPSSTIAWLLVILLLPYIGVPLYIMIGGRKMKRDGPAARSPSSTSSLQSPRRRPMRERWKPPARLVWRACAHCRQPARNW